MVKVALQLGGRLGCNRTELICLKPALRATTRYARVPGIQNTEQNATFKPLEQRRFRGCVTTARGMLITYKMVSVSRLGLLLTLHTLGTRLIFRRCGVAAVVLATPGANGDAPKAVMQSLRVDVRMSVARQSVPRMGLGTSFSAVGSRECPRLGDKRAKVTGSPHEGLGGACAAKSEPNTVHEFVREMDRSVQREDRQVHTYAQADQAPSESSACKRVKTLPLYQFLKGSSKTDTGYSSGSGKSTIPKHIQQYHCYRHLRRVAGHVEVWVFSAESANYTLRKAENGKGHSTSNTVTAMCVWVTTVHSVVQRQGTVARRHEI